jgi:WD40 repeat protein
VGDRRAHRLKLAPLVPVKNLQHPNLVDCVAFDDTGNLLATGCHDGVLRIWDLAKGAARKSINAHVQTTPQNVQSPIYAVLWTPDHKQIFTASFDKTVKLWDVAAGNLVREFKAAPGPVPIEPKKVEPKKEEKKVAKKVDPKLAAEFLGGLVRGDPPLPPGPPGHRDQVFSMALTRDGKFLATGSSDRSLKLWEVATGRVVREFPNPDLKPVLPGETAPSHPGWVQCVRLTPDGQFLVSAGPAPRGRSYLAAWRVADGKRVYAAEREFGPIHSLAITPDGTKLVLGCAPIRGKPGAEAVVISLPAR